MTAVTKNSMLGILADQIKDDLSRRESVREQWVAATLDLCKHLVEAKEQFKATKQFSEWLAANNLGDDVLGHQDRAAAIAMGEDLKLAGKVLAATERRSLQLIYTKEFRVTNASKSAKPPKQKTPPRVPPETEAVIVDVVFNKGGTRDEAEAAAGVCSTVVRRVVAAEEARRKVIDTDPTLDPAAFLSLSGQQKLAAFERRLMRQNDAKVDALVRVQVRKYLDEIFLPVHQKKLAQAERVIQSRKHLMSKADFNLVRACLHPDNSAGKERRDRAFDIFNKLEDLLIGEKELPLVGGAPPLPSSLAEWDRMRAETTAARAAKRARPR